MIKEEQDSIVTWETVDHEPGLIRKFRWVFY